MTDPLRIALCDDHAVVRAGLRAILERESGLLVVGEAGTVAEAVRVASENQPDVFVMDLGLPDASGLEGSQRVISASPSTNVLVLTVHDDIAYLRKAFASGATGYLVKDAVDVELVLAVRTVASGRRFVDPSLGAALVDYPDETPVAGPGGELSRRELEVLRLLSLGHTNAEIARQLYVSVRTIETHRSHIQQKLDVHTRAELVKLARDARLLEASGDE